MNNYEALKNSHPVLQGIKPIKGEYIYRLVLAAI